MARERNLVDSEDEEMEYSAPSAKRTKLSTEANGGSRSNGSSSNSNNIDIADEDSSMQIDEDGYISTQ